MNENTALPVNLLMGLIRHGLTFSGGAGLFTDDEVTQIAAAVATLVGLAWSGFRKWHRSLKPGEG